MDDRKFDLKSAQEWIATIESDAVKVRRQDIYPKLKSWTEKTLPGEILEIGCGQGACSNEIPLKGRRYAGIEASPYLLERARELYLSPERQFFLGNVYSIPFDDRAFDGVFSVAVWHLLSDLAKANRELSRVLKPGGSFLILTADASDREIWEARARESNDVLFVRAIEELIVSLSAEGLKVEHTEKMRNFIVLEGRKA